LRMRVVVVVVVVVVLADMRARSCIGAFPGHAAERDSPAGAACQQPAVVHHHRGQAVLSLQFVTASFLSSFSFCLHTCLL
jgi:hypothetical protein